MTTETELIDAINKLPGHTVYPRKNGYSVLVVYQRDERRCTQVSVLLGRKNTLSNLQKILEGQLA